MWDKLCDTVHAQTERHTICHQHGHMNHKIWLCSMLSLLIVALESSQQVWHGQNRREWRLPEINTVHVRQHWGSDRWLHLAFGCSLDRATTDNSGVQKRAAARGWLMILNNSLGTIRKKKSLVQNYILSTYRLGCVHGKCYLREEGEDTQRNNSLSTQRTVQAHRYGGDV